jgi:hypothetical protein
MTGRVHILRVGNRYRLVFVPSGPGRHLVEGKGALRNFLLTDLEIPPDATETAIGELDRSGRHTIEKRNRRPRGCQSPPRERRAE